MQTIQQTIELLHASLRNYIEATYHVSSETLIKQRRAILDAPGAIYQTPYLESTPQYIAGKQFSELRGLPEAALEIYAQLARDDGPLKALVYPPYSHQAKAVQVSLIDQRNLVIMTGTGSGKTESFLLPILGKLATEAKGRPHTFSNKSAVRALILYPMNALVNDQLGRLRSLFGDPRVVTTFKSWAGRPPRFARYTSRTPYAGVRTAKKDSQKLGAIGDFYANIQTAAEHGSGEQRTKNLELINKLKKHGKWPAKPDFSEWFGEKGSRWQDSKTGEFQRAVTLPDDSELLTRHEVQSSPPDVLITNYSMLEYMLMRPIERPIFEKTRSWLDQNPSEKFLIVLDEAHLYRGAAGAEVGLLLRRLRDRLGVSAERFQVICATASFSDKDYAPEFGAQLSGNPASSFEPIVGDLKYREAASAGSLADAEALARVDLAEFYASGNERGRTAVVSDFLTYRRCVASQPIENALHHALCDFPPMGLLVNLTMKQARPIESLGTTLFPDAPKHVADEATTVLMALGSIARTDPSRPSLLPCRIHNFFRGLPGLWVCMDPDCTLLLADERGGICGKMYGQPVERCDCGARVLELYTCRNCGTAYARAYTDDLDTPSALWSEPGAYLHMDEGDVTPLEPIDLLLEDPTDENLAEPADYDLETGRLNPANLGPRTRRIYLRSIPRESVVEDDDGEGEIENYQRGIFSPCGVCGRSASYQRSYVQDHLTKGDQPFQALVARQLQIQPPGPDEATSFAPLRGRKVLVFSDSRQVAARLAPNLQLYSVRDSLRPLITWGYQKLQSTPALQPHLNLEDLYLAVMLASKSLTVRLRPELKPGENIVGAETMVQNVVTGRVPSEAELLTLSLEMRSEQPPESLLDSIVTTVQDKFLGLEALAIASICERPKHTRAIEQLPDITGIATNPTGKVALARAWLRCWQRNGFWLSSMPIVWWRRPRTLGVSVRGQKGKFKAMDRLLNDRAASRAFWDTWSPALLTMFTQESDGGFRRLKGGELSLEFGGSWVHCRRCKSVHRPVPGLDHCLDCVCDAVVALNPETDPIFGARKGFYRRAVVEVLQMPPCPPMALIAAEHTAQLNSPQNEDVFSKAERNELLFQDIEVPGSGDGRNATAIDVLSSTTTMEVGIDIGQLSGVALRNMPPGRANYQQRAGRAGRRGNAVATVVAFGSADSHDEHYFSEPEGMICGAVTDPRLTLDNLDIVRRHVLAFLLQDYHQERLPALDPSYRHDLFSVLGTVSEFRNRKSILNRHDFGEWLATNRKKLQSRIAGWIPTKLSSADRIHLLETFVEESLAAVDDAIRPGPGEVFDDTSAEDTNDVEASLEEGEEQPRQASNPGKLLDRLLYCGKLPRYAFPTDVAAFSVFDRERSNRYKPIMRYSPTQGLPVALTQYAPGKQVWIAGKCYTSGAIYSLISIDRFEAWQSRRFYMECRLCGFARTFTASEVNKGEVRDCDACEGPNTFGPAQYWIRPPGFAHPIDLPEVTSPDDMPETSYASRAKLTMGTPKEDAGWSRVNMRILGLSARDHLLVSNSGPKRDGYTYCLKCGRIEASVEANSQLAGPHRKPFPDDDDRQFCDSNTPVRHLVLGTDFITDIALFSMRVAAPLRLRPGRTATTIALRTMSEALAKAACQLLEIESGEIMAEFRPALTPDGIRGLQAEVFLYDTLPGGAGFASQFASRGLELFSRALQILRSCPANCDASCYRCLRIFKNKFDHRQLDRHVAAELIGYLIDGTLPPFNAARIASATNLLASDLSRQGMNGFALERGARMSNKGRSFEAPICVQCPSGEKVIVALSGPLTADHAASEEIEALRHGESTIRVIVENELLVRGNLPAATSAVQQQLGIPVK